MGANGSRPRPATSGDAAPTSSEIKRELAEEEKIFQHDVPQDIQRLVNMKGLQDENFNKVIPCELCSMLHDNTRGSYQHFCSAAHKREWFDDMLQKSKAVQDLIQGWQDLNSDFVKEHAGVVGLAMPPFHMLQSKINERKAAQEEMYQNALPSASDHSDLDKLKRGAPLFPEGTPEEVKEFCIQPNYCMTMRLNYLNGLRTAGHLYVFAAHLVGASGLDPKQSIHFGVKKPLRMRSKAAQCFPAELALNDYRHSVDVYRVSIVASSPQQILKMVEILQGFGRDTLDRKEHMKTLGLAHYHENFVVERVKNRFVQPALGGYMDIVANVRINGYVSEVQIHLRNLFELQKDTGIEMAKWFKHYSHAPPQRTNNSAPPSPHGDGGRSGTTKFASGTYKGDLDEIGERHGMGTLFYNTGDRFEGQWVHGVKQGSGSYYYATGDVYKGDFHHDRMHGQGKFTMQSHEFYEGEFSDGRRHGQGQRRTRDGKTVEGTWWRNKRIEVVSM
mmetsp:Transcript_22475/g.57448  ORF Transcript_22475/g.57448 Transcript_22475/m.57448 type:complete len:502 (+) Transcript_22475:14-1519(+)